MHLSVQLSRQACIGSSAGQRPTGGLCEVHGGPSCRVGSIGRTRVDAPPTWHAGSPSHVTIWVGFDLSCTALACANWLRCSATITESSWKPRMATFPLISLSPLRLVSTRVATSQVVSDCLVGLRSCQKAARRSLGVPHRPQVARCSDQAGRRFGGVRHGAEDQVASHEKDASSGSTYLMRRTWRAIEQRWCSFALRCVLAVPPFLADCFFPFFQVSRASSGGSVVMHLRFDATRQGGLPPLNLMEFHGR